MSELFQILLIEDNPGDLRIAQEAFKNSKVKVNLSFVHDGAEAIDFLKRKGKFSNAIRPDLILLDLNLPKIDGREVLAEVKTDEDLKQIPIIVLTTSDSEQDINKCYLLGANSFITKPMELDSFLKAIKLIEEYWLTLVKLPKG